MRRFASLLLIQTVAASAAFADPATPTAPRAYVADVISNRTIYAIEEDPHGAMWLGGYGELYRHNGIEMLPASSLRAHTFPGTSIASLATRSDGTLWIGIGGGVWLHNLGYLDRSLEGGLSRFDGKTFTTYGPEHGLIRPYIHAMLPGADGSLWIGSDGCLFQHQGNDFKRWCEEEGINSNVVLSLGPDGNNPPIVGTVTGLFRFRDGRYHSMGLDAPVPAIAVTASGRIWAGTPQGLVGFDNDQRVAHMTAADGLPSDIVTQIAETPEGDLWIGTDRGLVRYHLGKRVDPVVDALQAFTNTRIVALHVDRTGTLWVSTYGKGLLRLRPRQVENFGAESGIDLPVHGLILDPRDQPVVTANRSVFRWQENRFERLDLPADWPEGDFGGATFDNKGTLILTGGKAGLVRLENGQFSRVPLPNRTTGDPTFLTTDPTGRLWIGFSDGSVVRGTNRAPDDWTDATTWSATGACNQAINAGSADAQGTAYFTSNASRILRIQDHAPPRCEEIPTAPDATANDVAADPDGSFWVGVGGDGGIVRNKNGERTQITSSNGLACDSTHALASDRKDFLWMSCRSLVVRIPFAELHRWQSSADLPVFNRSFGDTGEMQFAQATTSPRPTMAIDRSGRLWIANQLTVARITPASPRTGATKPYFQISRVSVNDEQRSFDRAGIDVADDHFDLTVDVGIVAMNPGGGPDLAYRLDGIDREWHTRRRTETTLTYPNLPEGRYRLRLRGSNGADGWSDEERTLTLHFHPHWYNRWEIRIAVVVALFALLLIERTRRSRKLVERFAFVQAERARIARELHDGIGQSFASIGLHLDALRLALDHNPTGAKEVFEDLRVVLERARRDTRESIWRLRNDTLEDTDPVQALQEIVRIQRENIGKGGPKIVLTVNDAPFTLSTIANHELAQIAREAVSNAVAHAQASHIQIDLHRRENRLRLRIVDDGKGLSASPEALAAGGHFGLVGMQERAKRAGGTVVIHSARNAGTEVIVEMLEDQTKARTT